MNLYDVHWRKQVSAMSVQAIERLNFRLPPDKKRAIEQAAAIRGLSITDFAILTLYEEAQEILRNDQVTVLSDPDRDAFLKALDRPPKPNKRLLEAAARYKMARKQGRLR
jgi:uncharacterized protein (DUF1778 family)